MGNLKKGKSGVWGYALFVPPETPTSISCVPMHVQVAIYDSSREYIYAYDRHKHYKYDLHGKKL